MAKKTRAGKITVDKLLDQLINCYILLDSASPDVDGVKRKIEKIIVKIEKGGIRCTRKKVNEEFTSKSQRGLLLKWLQKHPDYQVTAVDLQNRKWDDTPFIGSKPGSRLSELKVLGLVKVVGIKPGQMTFEKKSRPQKIYQITKKGLRYKFKDLC